MSLFYWPGIQAVERRWCSSCYESQLVNHRAIPRAPLHSISSTESLCLLTSSGSLDLAVWSWSWLLGPASLVLPPWSCLLAYGLGLASFLMALPHALRHLPHRPSLIGPASFMMPPAGGPPSASVALSLTMALLMPSPTFFFLLFHGLWSCGICPDPMWGPGTGMSNVYRL